MPTVVATLPTAMTRVALLVDGVENFHGAEQRVARFVGRLLRRAEHRHQPVAQKLVDRAVVAEDDGHDAAMEGADDG